MGEKRPLLPSLREKKRYVVFEIISKKKIKSFNVVGEEIWKSCLRFLGEYGCANANIKVLSEKWDAKKQKGIIRINNKHVNELKLALMLIKKIEDEDVIVRVVGVSGILKKTRRFFGGE